MDLKVLGVGRESAVSSHDVKVTSIKDGYVDLFMTWAENGHNPKMDGGTILMRGGDIKGSHDMTFHLASGMLVDLKISERRVDQTCGMDMIQRTRHDTTVSTFSITKR